MEKCTITVEPGTSNSKSINSQFSHGVESIATRKASFLAKDLGKIWLSCVDTPIQTAQSLDSVKLAADGILHNNLVKGRTYMVEPIDLCELLV